MSRVDALRRRRPDVLSPWTRCRAGGVLVRLAHACPPWMSRTPPYWPTHASIQFAAAPITGALCVLGPGGPGGYFTLHDIPAGQIVAASGTFGYNGIGRTGVSYVYTDPAGLRLTVGVGVCHDTGSPIPADGASPCRGRVTFTAQYRNPVYRTNMCSLPSPPFATCCEPYTFNHMRVGSISGASALIDFCAVDGVSTAGVAGVQYQAIGSGDVWANGGYAWSLAVAPA